MANVLISGPAGGGKSAIAREELAAQDWPGRCRRFPIRLTVALLQLRALGADGRFPVRPPWILPLVGIRREAHHYHQAAVNRDIAVICHQFGWRK